MAVHSYPSCAIKRAANMAASERKVLFLHDDYENATLLRRQMAGLSQALDELHFVSYFGNSPTQLRGLKKVGPNTDEPASFGCLWYGGDLNKLKQKSLPHVNQVAKRKGPFYAVVAVGAACELAKLVATAHGCQLITPELGSPAPATPDGRRCPVAVLSSTQFFTFEVTKETDSSAVLPLPVKEIAEFVAGTVQPGLGQARPMFNLPTPTREEVQRMKIEKKQADKERAALKAQENLERKMLKARKAAGEEVEVPPNQTKILYKERRRQRDAMKQFADEAVSGLILEDEENVLSGLSFCNYIVTPMAEPVTPCSVEELGEIIDYLKSNSKLPNTEIRMDFTKGSVLNHGGMAVDLCKQVVGPEGIEPILDAIGQNEHVVRFLLGNNISGDRGARAIASFIADKERSKNIYNFYLAGNEIGPSGMADIARSLEHDTKVQALFLKRNPIGLEGARHLASTLLLNTILQTLDLVNVGMFDDGAVAIFEALRAAIDTTGLVHLYVGSNALTARSARAAADFLATGRSNLKTLYFAAGRLGDEGAIALAEGLAKDGCLERLGLASERIGRDGALALADALQDHPRLMSLDLGLRKGTFALGEQPNCIGDEGAVYLAKKLLASGRRQKLRYLDLSHNQLTGPILDTILGLVEQQTEQSLLALKLHQRGAKWDSAQLPRLMGRNKAWFEELKQAALDGDEAAKMEVAEVEEILYPRHIFDIYSIYRNNM